MKKFTCFLIIALTHLLIIASASAQSPQKMSYQAVIRDAGSNLVTGQTVGIRISILQGSTTGTVLYTETQTPATNENGLISIEIGGGTGFSSINWATGLYFLKTEIDPAGGANYTLTGTSQLLSVPYALYSKSAESAADAVKLTGDQTIGGNKIFTGTTTVQTPVNDMAAATKAYVDQLLVQIEELEVVTGIKVKDKDGNIYNTVTIGTQIWMVENLRTTKYNDGTTIPLSTNSASPGYCWYNNDQSTYGNTYGALYNWYATSTAANGNKNICPAGWHVPSYAEWTTLINYLGGFTVAGGKLKETGTAHWNTPNIGATNETGFTALPGGYFDPSLGASYFLGNYGNYWSSTEVDTDFAPRYLFYSSAEFVGEDNGYKRNGFSVRCIKD